MDSNQGRRYRDLGDRFGFRYRYGRRSGTSGIILGLLITVAGALLLLDNFGIVRIHEFWRLWPLALIAVGMGKVIDSYHPGGRVWGGVLTAIGIAFLLDNLGYPFFDWNYVWPVLLIALGLSMMYRAMERRWPGESVPSNTPPSLNVYCVFSGCKRRIDSQEFEGGDMLAVFGGIEVDLRRAGLKNRQAVIEANATFGGIEIRVPENWAVTMKGVGLFGGYEDKTIPPGPDTPNPPRLIINGYAIFGGVAVKN